MNAEYSVEWHEAHAVFTINRPAKRNALTRAVLEGLSACLDEIERRGLRGLVVTGADGVFSAGTDLLEASTLSMAESEAKLNHARALFMRLYRSSITSVAAIDGLAYGGGMELAMACTLRVAGPTARFALPEVKLAILPAYGGTQLLPALVGRSVAADLLLTGRPVDATEAKAIGLVNRLAGSGESTLQSAERLLASITCHSQVAIAHLRACLAAASDQVTDEGLAVEASAAAAALTSEDVQEGLAAFLEKRPARFKHR
ncbi:MAG: enoyl-CoA hydratase/isomerase family protein [Gammaproteobacteria bacterium]|nr:MAG: enoyl-CoA hydratase/isomerase family protein [Gammaproteobacteria bacterium]